MNIVIKTPKEIEGIRKSSQLAAKVLKFIEPHLQVGVSTREIDKLCHDFIVSHGAIPSPLNYKGYPKSICTSVNEVVCHGIPGDYELRDGDIINVDVSTYLEGFHGDTSKTYGIGKVSRSTRDLLKATEAALYAGIDQVKVGGFFGDIAYAVQTMIELQGYSVVREYGGHGIGREFHEEPHVPHTGKKDQGPRSKPAWFSPLSP